MDLQPRSGDRQRPPQPPPPDHHRNAGSGPARAAVFGISDGLVTNVSLILGVAGAGPAASIVRLAGLASLLAGSFSMAAGEFVSMRAQAELLEKELEMERIELERNPEGERLELIAIYESRGVEPKTAADLVDQITRTPATALEAHAREELGVDPNELGSPIGAAVSSFVTFAIGALVPLVPWFFTGGTPAIVLSVVLAALAAVVIGIVLARFTGRSMIRSALRQLIITAGAAAITFGIGRLLGVSTAS